MMKQAEEVERVRYRDTYRYELAKICYTYTTLGQFVSSTINIKTFFPLSY